MYAIIHTNPRRVRVTPRKEVIIMGIMRFNYRSEILGHWVDITVAYPTDSYRCEPTEQLQPRAHNRVDTSLPVYKPGMKFQTLYFIHGGGDDDSLVYRYTNVERYARENHVMLVTPNIANSFGYNAKFGVPYMTFLTEELPTVIQTLFASSPKREDNFIAGFAMGGNVALGAAINRPDRYCYCLDMSGGIGMNMDAERFGRELDGDLATTFPLYPATFGHGDEIPGSMADLAYQYKKHKEAGDPEVKFVVACGSKEFIRDRVENDVKIMQELGMDMEYILAEGYDHDYDMWDKYIRLALEEMMPLKRKAIYPEDM